MWSALGYEPLNNTARWVEEPRVRGSYSILSSCLVTLSLCVWTVLHLNVPEHRHSKRRFWWKVLWLVTGLLAPEIVALAAYRQYAEQRQLTADMEKALGARNPKQPKVRWYKRWYRRVLVLLHLRKKDELEVQPGQRSYPWTGTHSFLAVMGGFVFDNGNQPDQCPLPGDRQRITLTSDGLLQLAQLAPELIPDVSLEAIRDKSKADSFAKMLACIQALWFCLQVVTRLGQRLPVTLLELNTFAHALCALIIFLIWWDKPLDVSDAFVLPVTQPRNHPPDPAIRRTAAFCAAMCNYGQVGYCFPCWVDDGEAGGDGKTGNGCRKAYHQTGFFRAYGYVVILERRLFEYVTAEQSQQERANSRSAIAETNTGGDAIVGINTTSASATAANAQANGHANGIADGGPFTTVTLRYGGRHQFAEFTEITYGTPWISLLSVVLSEITVRRSIKERVSIDVPADFWVRARLTHPQTGVLTHNELRAVMADNKRTLVCDRAPNWSFALPQKLDRVPEVFLAYSTLFAIASLVYGAWHLLAWAGPFHGHTEKLLWRGSGIGVGAASVAICAHLSLIVIADRSGFTADRPVVIALLLAVLVPIPAYMLFLVACRLCLVVESLVGMAYVPDGVFELPNWSVYFPHIM